MILARTNNDTRILGSISSAAGLGGVTGTVLLSIWGGSKRRINGFLLGMMGAGVSKTIFALGQGLMIWLPAQFCSSLNFPMLTSSSTAILLSKVKPDIQGRVFATESIMQQIVSAIAVFIAALLADHVFEPAMMPGGNFVPLFGNLFGTGKGAGMAILYVISSISLLLIGLSGYFVPQLRNVELGYDAVQFVDVSTNPENSSVSVRAINQLAAEHTDINVDFIGSVSIEDAIGLMKQPSDIVIGVKSAQTVGIINFLANQGKAIAAYIPQTQEFDRWNLPIPNKTVEVARNNPREER